MKINRLNNVITNPMNRDSDNNTIKKIGSSKDNK